MSKANRWVEAICVNQSSAVNNAYTLIKATGGVKQIASASLFAALTNRLRNDGWLSG